eukprot:scpid87991/ scgid2853/ 
MTSTAQEAHTSSTSDLSCCESSTSSDPASPNLTTNNTSGDKNNIIIPNSASTSSSSSSNSDSTSDNSTFGSGSSSSSDSEEGPNRNHHHHQQDQQERHFQQQQQPAAVLSSCAPDLPRVPVAVTGDKLHITVEQAEQTLDSEENADAAFCSLPASLNPFALSDANSSRGGQDDDEELLDEVLKNLNSDPVFAHVVAAPSAADEALAHAFSDSSGVYTSSSGLVANVASAQPSNSFHIVGCQQPGADLTLAAHGTATGGRGSSSGGAGASTAAAAAAA